MALLTWVEQQDSTTAHGDRTRAQPPTRHAPWPVLVKLRVACSFMQDMLGET